jgi:hypothetical protein
MELRIVSRRNVPEGSFPTVELAVEGGRLIVDCDDEEVVEEISNLLMKRVFVEGKGFPVYMRDAVTHAFTLDPMHGNLVVAGHIDMRSPGDMVLRAIKDCLMLGGEFVVLEVP